MFRRLLVVMYLFCGLWLLLLLFELGDPGSFDEYWAGILIFGLPPLAITAALHFIFGGPE